MKFIYGLETYWIHELTTSITKQFKGEIISFNETSSLDSIFEEILNISLFNQKKLIIIKNHPLFTDNNLAILFVNFIKKKYQDIEFLFILETNQLQTKNLLVNYLLKHSEIHQVKTLDEKNVLKVIKEFVEKRNGSITTAGAIQLVIKLPLNLWMIANELEKLLINYSEINELVINQNTSDYTKDNFFALSNAILTRDYQGIVQAYQDRLNLGDEETFIINQIAGILELGLLINAYYKQGLTNQEIAKMHQMHLFRVKKSYELISLAGEIKVKRLLQALASLDFRIKSGLIDKSIGLNHFVLKLLNQKFL